VTYSNITGLITIANSNPFLLNFTNSSMYVALGFLPQLYPTTTSITVPYALNLGMPTQVHIYVSKVINSYIGVQGGYDMPTFIVPVDATRGTIVNFRSENDYSQYVDIPNPIDINCITVKLKSPSMAAGLPPKYRSLNGSKYCMILEAARRYWGGHIFIMGVQLSQPSYKYGKVEHLLQRHPGRPNINIATAQGLDGVLIAEPCYLGRGFHLLILFWSTLGSVHTYEAIMGREFI